MKARLIECLLGATLATARWVRDACYLVGQVLVVVIYFWSLAIAWPRGYIPTWTTAALPPFAQIYWVVVVGRNVDWCAPYCVAVWSVGATIVIGWIATATTTALSRWRAAEIEREWVSITLGEEGQPMICDPLLPKEEYRVGEIYQPRPGEPQYRYLGGDPFISGSWEKV